MLGVLVIMGTLFGLVWAVDAHYVTRAEYDATQVAIRVDLTEIKAQLRELRSEKLAGSK
jgi:hypothetical protein